MTETEIKSLSTGRLGIVHCAVTGAVALGIIFVACWLGAVFTSMPVTHMFISMFTPAAVSSPAALIQGSCWSLVFGAWAGFVIAVVSNFVARFGLQG